MASFVDKLEVVMGAELYRPDQSYIAKYVFQPPVVHDFSLAPGSVARMKRYGFWNDPGSYNLTARTRSKGQIIGTGGGRGLPQEEVLIKLEEQTGPSAGDPSNPNQPGALRIDMLELIQAQRNIYNLQTPDQFHQSIGSITLFQDYKRFKDSVYINLALSANPVTATGGQVASNVQGGYYNPRGVANGGTYNTVTGAPRMSLTRDIAKVVSDMRSRLVPPFQSNMGDCYHALCTPGFMQAVRQDPRFIEVARYPGIPASMLSTPSLGAAPMMPPFMDWTISPNDLVRQGGFYGQTGFMHSVTMPMGLFWEGIRFFESTNVPTAAVTLTTSGLASEGYSDGSAQSRTAEIAIIFGRDAIGEAMWSRGARVLLSKDDDFGRFLIAIWQEYAGYTVLNPTNVTVLRTFLPWS